MQSPHHSAWHTAGTQWVLSGDHNDDSARAPEWRVHFYSPLSLTTCLERCPTGFLCRQAWSSPPAELQDPVQAVHLVPAPGPLQSLCPGQQVISLSACQALVLLALCTIPLLWNGHPPPATAPPVPPPSSRASSPAPTSPCPHARDPRPSALSSVLPSVCYRRC